MANTCTLLEFATDKMLTVLLIKERAKCRGRNKSDKKKRLDRECNISTLSTRKMLSRMMPPRHTWVRPSKRVRLPNDAVDTSKNAEKALLLTIKRDRKLQREGKKSFRYLQELDTFIIKIRKILADESIAFESPQLIPILKSQKVSDKGGMDVVCRPLASYKRLEDRIILSLTTRYLSRLLDRYLHENILSYRPARSFHGKEHYVTDFNDGIELINEFRLKNDQNDIYVSDCDIKKFYDCIPHNVVIKCFTRLLNKTSLNKDAKAQVMKVVEAYLKSYNFYTNVWIESKNRPKECFAKIRKRLHDRNNAYNYMVEWVDEIMALPDSERLQRGVPQGGALSLLIANVVLNDVDQVIVANDDVNRLFIRYCDDMILMHTSRDECERLMVAYSSSLTEHGLYYHGFELVRDSKDLKKRELTTGKFWNVKSHYAFKWGDGDGDSNRYIGFVGYEMRRNGFMRLRKSNINRFKEKTERKFYALRRYNNSEKYSDEEKARHQRRTLDQLLAGVNFYKGFDLEKFKRGRQYKYIRRLINTMEKRLNKQ